MSQAHNFALFPLAMVIFPGEEIRLHIFEERYKSLIHDCLTTGIRFGIPPYLEGKSLTLGTELELLDIYKTYSDGQMDIITKALRVFKIDDFYKKLPGKLYAGGDITYLEWNDTGDITYSSQIVSLIKKLYQVMNINNVKVPDPSNYKTHQLVHKIGLTIHQELELLNMRDEVERQIFILDHLNYLIPIVTSAETLRKRAELNGHFINFDPLGF